jgi:nucleotide-binding universal stress UspA family protein
MKIVLAVDGSQFSVHTLAEIVTRFRAEKTEVMVLRVLQPAGPTPPEMESDYAPELQREKEPAHALVERLANQLRTAGFKADTAVRVGDARECIIDSAGAWGANLIVVGSHGQRGIRRFLLGSVAEFVARHAKCSVEIVRSQESI